MHEDRMKKLQGVCVSWLVLLTGAAQLLLVCGEGLPGMFNFYDFCHVQFNHCMDTAVYLSLGSTNITTNDTEILITEIGEDAEGLGGLPYLSCHTRGSDHDGRSNEELGEWRYPNGMLIHDQSNAGSTTAGEQFYFVVNAPQTISLARRQSINPPPLSPTGSYCCTIPTTGGEMTLCANLGEWFCNRFHPQSPSSCVPVSRSLSPDQWNGVIQRLNTGSGHCGHLHLSHWLHSQWRHYQDLWE